MMLILWFYFIFLLKFSACQQKDVSYEVLAAETTQYLNNINPVEVDALGRLAQLGAFYDAHENKFIESVNLFSASKNNDEFNKFITTTETKESSIKYSIEHDIKEKFHLLDVGAAIKVDILGGYVNLYDGYGKYFRDTKKSEKSSRATLISSILTNFEEITVTDGKLNQYVDFDILEKIEASHVVVGILWGGRVFITVEDVNNEEHDITDIEGKLGGIVKKLGLGIGGDPKFQITGDELSHLRSFKFEIFGDLIPDEKPQNMSLAFQFIRDSPKELLKQNDGKGRPMKFILLPTKILKQLWKRTIEKDRVLVMIDDHVANMFVAFFDEINKVEQKLNDIKTDTEFLKLYLPPKLVSKFVETFDGFMKFKIQTKETVAKKTIAARKGESMDHLKDVIREAKANQNSHTNILNNFNNLFGRLKEEISFVKALQRLNLTVLHQERFLNDYLTVNHNRDTFILIYNFDLPREVNIAVNTFRTLFQIEEKERALAILNINIVNYKIPYELPKTPTVAHFKQGKLITGNYVVDTSKLKVANLWTVDDMSKILAEVSKINNPAPADFHYVQYPYMDEPKKLYPKYKWQDVSSKYDSAFFRASGNYSQPGENPASFGEKQDAKNPMVKAKAYVSGNFISGTTPVIGNGKGIFAACPSWDRPCPMHELVPHQPMTIAPFFGDDIKSLTNAKIGLANEPVPAYHWIKIWKTVQ